MIKRKTKEQIKQDSIYLDQKYTELIDVSTKFIQDLYDSDLNPRWITMGSISDIMEAIAKTKSAKNRFKNEFTFTSHEEDFEHMEWKNSTYIKCYE